MDPQALERVVIVSDTHFGHPGATLGITGNTHEPSNGRAQRDRVAALFDALKAGGPVDEIILLGDIFELWTATFEGAVASARPFLDGLRDLDPGRIVFVPGNHDYHLLVQHRDHELRRAVLDGQRPPWSLPLQQTFERSHLAGLLPESLGERLVVTYPNYRRQVNGCRFVFHHGHNLATIRGGDVFALGPRFVLERLERLPIQSLTLQSLERGNHVFCEITHALATSAGARDRVLGFWSRLVATRHALQAARSFLSMSSGRTALASNRGTLLWDVSNFRQPARHYLRLMAEDTRERWQPDVLVFGHTHRQGIAEVESEPGAEEKVREVLRGDLAAVRDRGDDLRDFHLVNTGCWLREPDKPNEGHVDIVAVVEAQRLTLNRFDQGALLPVNALQLEPAPEVRADGVD